MKSAWDPALAVYKELEGVDLPGFKELALYHQARVHESKGDTAKAKEILVDLKGRFDKPEERPNTGVPAGPAFPYLKEVAMDRLRKLDPEAAPKMQGMPGGGSQVLPAHIKKMLEDQAKQQQQGGGH